MKQLIYISIFCFGIIACTEPINLDLDDAKTNRLIVEGSITNEYKIHVVSLSRTGDFLGNERTPRELNAIVNITDGDTIINLYDPDDDGTYETEKELAGKLDHQYTLNITLSNGEQYAATEPLNPIAPLDSVGYVYEKSFVPFSKDYIYNVNIFVQEPPEPGQYYQWELFIDGVHETDTVGVKRFESDELVNGNYFNNWTVYEIEESKIKKEETEVKLQMLSISKAKYDFNLALVLETEFSGSGFSGDPANIPTNISNGALGFFNASAVTEKTITIKRAGAPPE